MLKEKLLSSIKKGPIIPQYVIDENKIDSIDVFANLEVNVKSHLIYILTIAEG